MRVQGKEAVQRRADGLIGAEERKPADVLDGNFISCAEEMQRDRIEVAKRHDPLLGNDRFEDPRIGHWLRRPSWR